MDLKAIATLTVVEVTQSGIRLVFCAADATGARIDAALEKIDGRLNLELHITAARGSVDWVVPES